ATAASSARVCSRTWRSSWRPPGAPRRPAPRPSKLAARSRRRGTWSPPPACGGCSTTPAARRPLREPETLERRSVGRPLLERRDVQRRQGGHVGRRQPLERQAARNRVDPGIRGGLVHDDLVPGRVALEQRLDEQRQARRLCLAGGASAPDGADLPEEERRGRIDDPAAEQEVGRLVALAAAGGGVDAEVGEQAV